MPIQERTDLNYSEIRILLDELSSKLSSIPNSRKSFYISPFAIRNYNKNIVYNLQKLSDNMCYYLGLLVTPRVIYIEEQSDNYGSQKGIFYCDSNGTVHTYENEREYAGLYTENFQNQSVTIVSKRGYTLDNLFGILAHEITYHFLHHFNIRKPNEKENEIFTDISAIYLGFGLLLYSAYQIISYDSD